MQEWASIVTLGSLQEPTINSAEEAFLQQYPVSGITVFSRNIADKPKQGLQALKTRLNSLTLKTHPSMIMSIDQEGGRVRRIRKEIEDLGPPLLIAQGSTEQSSLNLLEQYGAHVGKYLQEAGVNLNFAPVVDIGVNENNQGIGDRVFAKDLEGVIARAGAFLKGMSPYTAGCLKHFPGQGDAVHDTHLSSSIVNTPKELMLQREIPAFVPLFQHSSVVMIAHCIYSNWDDCEASRSPVIVQELLKKQLGFKGLVVSDDMTMQAIPQDPKLFVAAMVDSIMAGVDLVLICKGLEHWRLTIEGLSQHAQQNPLFAKRLKEAAEKVLEFRQSLN